MELLKRQEAWNITYIHALGETASWFFTQIRNNAKLYGKRDAVTGRVLVPPRGVLRPVARRDHGLGRGRTGERIEAFTIVYEPFENLPEPPYAFGFVMLDNADTAIGGFFKGVDLANPTLAARKLAIGTRVKTTFADIRKGDTDDFWFQLE